MRRAVFLDRDGVLNANVFYPDTGCWEAPRTPAEWRLLPGVISALRDLQRAGFLLFVVSNQPNVAKGKATEADFEAMRNKLAATLGAGGVRLAAAYYCLHHPDVTGSCACRKPSPFFLERAARVYGIVPARSWMVGDRATDMECGRAAGVRTVWIRTGQEAQDALCSTYDQVCAGLPDAAAAILARG